MKESYVEELAAHSGPESCVVAREGKGEASTGVRAGRVLSRESNLCLRADLRGADAVEVCGRLHPAHRQREMGRDPARSKTSCMYGNTWRENWTVLRQTMAKRLQAKLSEVKAELRHRWPDPIPDVGQWLGSVARGHLRYYGVPMNGRARSIFRFRVAWHWHRALARTRQTGWIPWERMRRLVDRWLLPARVCHAYPLRRLGLIT